VSARAGILGLVLLAACPPPDRAPPLPLCVTGFHIGETLALRLVQPYDAESDFVFDPSLLGGVSPSCGGDGVDSLSTGATVTLALATQLPNVGLECAPLGRSDPPSLAYDNGRYVWGGPGVTVAGLIEEAPFRGGPAYVTVALFTPSTNPWAPLAPRELPSLVVVRRVDSADGSDGSCVDAWVATWVSEP
jgi:hypothetical protein